MPTAKQRGHAPVFLILILAGLVGVWFLTKPQVEKGVNPTKVEEKIKVYKDNELEFQFEYPPDFEVVNESEEQYSQRTKTEYRKNFKYYIAYEPPKFVKGLLVKPKDMKLSSNQFEQVPLTLWIFENPDKLGSESWYKNYWYYPFVWGIFDEPRKSSIAPEMEGTTIPYQPGKPKFLLLPKEDKMFLFKIIEEDDKVGSKILASFKFL